YTPEGGRVRVAVRDGAEPVLSVTDNGPGIPPELREKALERFVRLEPHRSTPGNGLGLSVAAQVAQVHGGRLELKNLEPRGFAAELWIRVQPA
ncbi:MAG: sensor histidine kinase, partial [Meiothermus ruber]|uniref:ATP-binding protein n=1 Tax=Meiothermus ruber TaxID=277 RepID=UPI003918EE7D